MKEVEAMKNNEISFTDENIQKLFGSEDAGNENPTRLKEYFFRNKAYESLRANIPIRILIGHKGVGKSALLKVSELQDKEDNILSIWIKPDDFPSLDNAKEINSLIREWKFGIIQLVTEKSLEKMGLKISQAVGLDKIETTKGIVDYIAKIITNKSMPLTNEGKITANAFLKNRKINVYIDDLDRGWAAKERDIKKISALLNAIRDLCGAYNRLQIRIALRTDVYFLVRTSDESTDKIESNIIWMEWTNHEILTLMAKRVATFQGETVDESYLIKKDQQEIAKKLHSIIDDKFKESGKWSDAPIHRILLSLTRKRPRDLIKLLTGAAKQAHKNGNKKITTDDLKNTFENYSNERLQDIINEFKTELPLIEALIVEMKPTTNKKRGRTSGFLYTHDELNKKIENIMEHRRFTLANGRQATKNDLANFLYKVDFIIARKDNGPNKPITRKYFEQNRMLQNQYTSFGFSWEIHPAYRWALQPETTHLNEIFETIEIELEKEK